jgi:hypothetical protein
MFISRSIPRLLATAALAALTFDGAKAQSTAVPVARLLAETANLAAVRVRCASIFWPGLPMRTAVNS